MRVFLYAMLLVIVLLAVVQQLWYLPKLPENVASHFGADGIPNGSMPKAQFTWLMIGLHVGMPSFLGIMAATIRFMPNSVINMPNKEYWLAPERRPQTLLVAERTLVFVAAFTTLFLMGMSHLTFQANVAAQGLDMPKFWLLMAVYLGIVIFLVVGSMRYFRLPASELEPEESSVS